MFFLDSTGFLSLLCLVIQCGLAWVFAAFLTVLSAEKSPWLRRWRVAFVGLAIGLLVLTVRFLWSHHAIAGEHPLRDGEPIVRWAYAIYLAGKVHFLWFLVGGVAALRGRTWPGARWPAPALVGAAGLAGYALPTIESILLAQAPCMTVGFGMAAWFLRRRPGEEPDVGRRVVRGVLAAWSLVWVLYAVAGVIVGPNAPRDVPVWNVVLRLNSLIDLTLQVTLATGLIVVVMSDAQRAIVTALAERDRLRDQVRRDEKMRAVTTLVSGVAHEINNPLTAILGFAEDLAAADPELRTRAARVVQDQAERCRAIVQRMSMLGRRSTQAVAAIGVVSLVQRVVCALQPQLAQAGVLLRTDLQSLPRVLYADPTALEQVLTNLVVNALHVSKRGGSIFVRTSEAPDGISFVVEDEGPGVPVADRSRIFEPFWTTKEAGQGTGLGLAVAQALVHAHGGRITVDDSPRGGARFTVVVPWGEPPRDEAAPLRHAPPVAPLPTGMRLLVVDDEALVRSTIARYAVSEGWSVAEAASGEEGLRMLLQGNPPFDAVVCDLRMPGMSGMGLYDEVQRRAPHLLPRLLFVTGDLASTEAAAFAERCEAPILTKPFVVKELFVRLRQVARTA